MRAMDCSSGGGCVEGVVGRSVVADDGVGSIGIDWFLRKDLAPVGSEFVGHRFRSGRRRSVGSGDPTKNESPVQGGPKFEPSVELIASGSSEFFAVKIG